MNGAKQSLLIFVLILAIRMLMAAPAMDTEMERKAVRSPSLRLRFGRRSDPSFNPFQMEKINQKPIRSPSLRLRFGRRNDPLFPTFNQDLLNDELTFKRPERKPASRLRWGRSAATTSENSNEEIGNPGDVQMTREERKPARLRWGRSDGGNMRNSILTDEEINLLAQLLLQDQESLNNFLEKSTENHMTLN
ncbi:short neuropeptide F isoform X2 [Lutzomyia longipalpis]|uniref:Putative short neuropeptide f n=1 Tax=Lutzomyia longipalpis TaxID=7200 RepID=A0A7G3AYV1_LUTLO|nr:short neuropeptide F isoform X2 [Lutzomyia longipalpis]XP_055682786.1 short neuropeptide F isoform X2 [Lutzomyia longipalpis]